MVKTKRRRTDGKSAAAEEQIRRFNIACMRDDLEGVEDIESVDDNESLAQGERDYKTTYFNKVIPAPEWKTFTRTMRQPLYVTIRLETNTHAGDILATHLQNHTRFARGEWCLNFGGSSTVVEFPTDKKDLKLNPTLKTLNTQIAREMILGHLSRQEVVSMLPACIAGVKPGLRVLELCACPGSKTRQMLSMLSNGTDLDHKSLLVSNDSDNDRMSMLSDQFETAANGAKPNLVLTNARGDDLCYLIQDAERKRIDHHCSSPSSLLFDMVFVDVPCSGDGTFRKAPELWKTWSQDKALSLQPLQESLLTAAFAACKVGGLVVFSTCSLNPIENEQVVKHVLHQHHLRRKQGVLDGENDDVNFDIELVDAVEYAVRNGCTLKLRRGVTDEQVETPHKQDSNFSVNFDNCCRLLPQDNNTGGFFISLFRKTKPSQVVEPSHGGGIDTLKEGRPPPLSKEASLKALHQAGFLSAVPPRDEVSLSTQCRRPLSSQEMLCMFDDCGFDTALLAPNNIGAIFSSSSIGDGPFSFDLVESTAFSSHKGIKSSTASTNVRDRQFDSTTPSPNRLVYVSTTSASRFISSLPKSVVIRSGVCLAHMVQDANPSHKETLFRMIPSSTITSFVRKENQVDIDMPSFINLCREALDLLRTKSASSQQQISYIGHHTCSVDITSTKLAQIISPETFETVVRQWNKTKSSLLFCSRCHVESPSPSTSKARISKKQRQLMKRTGEVVRSMDKDKLADSSGEKSTSSLKPYTLVVRRKTTPGMSSKACEEPIWELTAYCKSYFQSAVCVSNKGRWSKLFM